MQVNYEQNMTMFMIGKSDSIVCGSPEGNMIEDILKGMGLPLNEMTYTLLASGINGGKILGKREERQKCKKA